MAISFNSIPVSIRVPGTYVEIDASRAVTGLFRVPTKILLIGQKLSGGTATALVPVRLTSADQARVLFGRPSMLAHMAERLFGATSLLETWAIPLQDLGGGATATGKLTFAGTATAAGTVELYIGGRRVRVGVDVGDGGADVAAAVAAAITADLDVEVTAVQGGEDHEEEVDISARHKGECGNSIDLRVNYHTGEALPAGITVTIAAMSGGTGNPDITGATDVIGDTWYTDIVTPYTDTANLAALEGVLDDLYGPLSMRDGHAWAAATGSFGTVSALGDARNSPHLTIMGAGTSPTPPWEWAAALAGIAAYYLSIDPARPLQTLPLPGILPPARTAQWTFEERALLLFDGIATHRVTDDQRVVIERSITTYKTNAFGAADPSFLDVTTLKTLALLRYDLRTLMQVRFPRHKLADDGTRFSRGQAVVTPKVIRDEIVARFGQWEEQGLVENVDQFKADLIVERDADDVNRVNALVPPDLVNQLRVLAAQIQFRL